VASGIFGAGSTAGVFVAGIALSLCWLIFDPWLKRHLPFRSKQPPAPDLKADADLRRRCRQLGQQIAFFAANRRNGDPSHVPHWQGLPENATEEQKNQAFNQSTQGIIQYMTETMNQYNVQFMGPALALFDELLARGWVTNDARWRFEYPTNPLGIDEVARTFQRIGEA
jgi:hypothetical protein